MLTIREPISIKCGRPMFSSYDIFAEKITGNYKLIPADIERTDLLHLVTMPPEVYIEGGDNSSILTDSRITNIRETKIDVISNMLNRIALTEEVNLTYQDRAFITDVLQRLGVTDVSLFMNELTAMKQEINDVNELTRLYQSDFGQLRQIFEGSGQTQDLVRNVEQNYADQERITLHEDIMKRLNTEDVYQDLYNFYIAPPAAANEPAQASLMLSEQERVLSQLRLNTLETRLTGESVPLVYRYENRYVDENVEEETYTQATADSRITQALLLDLASDLYVYVTGEAAAHGDNWIDSRNIFYQAAENTLQRLSLRTEGPFFYSAEVTRQLGERLERYENESLSIRELMALRQTRTEQSRIQTFAGETESEAGQMIMPGVEPLELIYQNVTENEEPREEGLPAQEITTREEAGTQGSFIRVINTYLSQLFPVRRMSESSEEIVTAPSERRTDTAASIPLEPMREEMPGVQPPRDEGMELKFLTGQKENPAEEPSEERPVRGEHTAEIQAGNESAGITNVYNSQLPTETTVSEEGINIIPTPGGPRADAGAALNVESVREEIFNTGPSQQPGIELTYLAGTEESRGEESGETDNGTAGGNTPAESAQEAARRISSSREMQLIHEREIHAAGEGNIYNNTYEQTAGEINAPQPATENLSEEPQATIPPRTEEEELARQIDEINRQNEETYRRIIEFAQQHARQGTSGGRHEGTPASRMREESLRALEHPEEVLMEHRQRQSEEQMQAEAAENELLEIMPAQSREILEQLQQIQQRRMTGEVPESSSQNEALTQLLYDISEVEEENRTEEKRISENRQKTEEVSETVLEERREYENPAGEARTRSEREYETVSLIHRTLENTLNEDEIADIVARSQVVQRETRQVIRTEENTERQQVQQQVNQTQTSFQQTEDINEMVRQSIRQQMGTISDEIYTQMERRLDRERKRRGY